MWAYESLFPELLIWILVASFSVWAMVQVYETLFRSHTRARNNRAAINALFGRNELRLHVPSSIVHMAARRGMRIQIAVLDREDRINTVNPYPNSATSLVVENEIKSAPQVNNSVKTNSFVKYNYVSKSSSFLAAREAVKKKEATGAGDMV